MSDDQGDEDTPLYLQLTAIFTLVLIALAGGIFPIYFRPLRDSKLGLGCLNSFAGGIFVSLALNHLLPDAIEDLDSVQTSYPLAFSIALAGYVFLLFLEKILFDTHSTVGHAHAHTPLPSPTLHPHSHHDRRHGHSSRAFRVDVRAKMLPEPLSQSASLHADVPSPNESSALLQPSAFHSADPSTTPLSKQHTHINVKKSYSSTSTADKRDAAEAPSDPPLQLPPEHEQKEQQQDDGNRHEEHKQSHPNQHHHDEDDSDDDPQHGHSHAHGHGHGHSHSPHVDTTGSHDLMSPLSPSMPSSSSAQPVLSSTYLLMLALSVHSVFEGIALGVQNQRKPFAELFLAIAIHKGAEAIALAASVLKHHGRSRSSMVLLFMFSFASPLGIVLGIAIASTHSEVTVGVFTALAAGTFLYVSTTEICAEEFTGGHKRERGSKFLSFLLGVGLICGLTALDQRLGV